MIKRSLTLLVFLLILGTVYSIFPTPKHQNLSTTEYIQILDVCKIRHVLNDNQKDSQAVLKMFKQVDTQSRYYFNKILKRKNGNIHCSNDLVLIDQEVSHLIDLKVQIDQQNIKNNEGYTLKISKHSPHIIIIVKSYSGYVYALQTLSQMIIENRIQLGQIQDEPLVPHRGIMIDSARHFLKYDTIARLIQSMPLSKLNILHWHLSDDESFTLQLASHPQLSQSSAFKPGQIYTIDQVKQLIALGKKNGVSIVPELDTPGHVRAWGLDPKWKQQNITILCPKGQGYNHQFDLSKQVVYSLAQDVYRQIDNLFRDSPYIHLGGDQVFGSCWDLRPAIKTFMKTKNIQDYGQLQMYWRFQMKQALPQNRSVVFWRNDDQNIKISGNDVIHYWGNQNDTFSVLGNSTSKIILSPSDYLYISHGFANIWWNRTTGAYNTWKQIYQGFQLFPDKIDKSRILGAQVTLWGEVSNDDTLENNIWMRATAFGQKLWTDQVKPIKELVKEVFLIQKELTKMGVSPSPIVSQFCEIFTDKCLLS